MINVKHKDLRPRRHLQTFLIIIAALGIWLTYYTAFNPKRFGFYRDDSIYVVMGKALSTGKGAGNPFDLAVYTEDSGYTQVYIAKEIFAPRIKCQSSDPNISLDIYIYSIQELGRKEVK